MTSIKGHEIIFFLEFHLWVTLCGHCVVPVYDVFVSQLICYVQVCSKYDDVLFRGSILVSKLHNDYHNSSSIWPNYLQPLELRGSFPLPLGWCQFAPGHLEQ